MIFKIIHPIFLEDGKAGQKFLFSLVVTIHHHETQIMIRKDTNPRLCQLDASDISLQPFVEPSPQHNPKRCEPNSLTIRAAPCPSDPAFIPPTGERSGKL